MNLRSPDIAPPVAPTRTPRVKFPAGATDCHAHVFGPQARYPLLPATHFVPHVCVWQDYREMLRSIGCQRAVLVQPSVYGTDNTAIEEALAQSDIEMRAVAVVSPDIADGELERLHGLGFRGIRINTASWTQGLNLADARGLAERIRHLGWHLQFYANFREQPEVEDILAALPVPIVIDHFGRILTSEGTAAPAFQSVLRLLRRDHCHAKLIGPYFISDQFPAYRDIAPFARAMVEAAPDRVLWGTDWPHASAREKMQDDGDLADMLEEWVPDEKARHKVLVSNPARLYGFTAG